MENGLTYISFVAKDVNMNAGIATAFKNEFGWMEALWKQQAEIEKALFLTRPPRSVVHLITKEPYSFKPS